MSLWRVRSEKKLENGIMSVWGRTTRIRLELDDLHGGLRKSGVLEQNGRSKFSMRGLGSRSGMKSSFGK